MAHDFKLFPELRNSQMEVYYWDSPHKQIVESFTGNVIRVIDGDTIRIKTEFRDFDFPVRMFAIDAPELKTPDGQKSKSWLEQQILGEEVEIIINPKNRIGKWGRIIGDILHLGQSMSEESLNWRMSVIFGEEQI